MNNSLELLTYNARTECMRGWLISNAYVGIKRSSKQWEAGASDFQASRWRLFCPLYEPNQHTTSTSTPSLRKLSLSSHLLRQRRPTGRRLLSTSTFLSFAKFQLSLQTLWLSLPFLYQIWYITPVNNFCTMWKLLFSPSMNVNCLPVISPLKTFWMLWFV